MTTTIPMGTARARRGGFSLRFLTLEIRRMLRNRRTLIFALILPPVFFVAFGSSEQYRTQSVGSGNVTAYILVGMAVYGAMIASTSGGAMVAIERSLGWSRQLRLTPLRPVAYIAVKIGVALIMGLASVLTVLIVGAFFGAQMPTHVWITSALLAFASGLVFAGLGLLLGYVFPSDNVMQILGPGMALLGLLGGLFVPLEQFGSTFATIAEFSPAYGVSALARYPLTHDGNFWLQLLSISIWTTIFVAGAAWRFRRDTARV